jgi:hydrophobic/amphiphilic exporter-1 (mainly G- bacteria), HAE1 family
MLKQELFPSLDFPAVSVVTVDAGASPTIVEHDVTNPLEQSIRGIAGIQQMTSYSNQGSRLLSSSITSAPTSTRPVRR